MAELNLRDLVRVAQSFNDLGWSIQEQLVQSLDGDYDSCNPNALRRAAQWFEQVARVLDSEDATDKAEDIKAYLES